MVSFTQISPNLWDTSCVKNKKHLSFTGGGPFDEIPLLADSDLEVTLSVLINDDPSGLLRFNAEDMDISVPEDYYPGDEDTTVAHLRIDRDQGDFEEIMVMGEEDGNWGRGLAAIAVA